MKFSQNIILIFFSLVFISCGSDRNTEDKNAAFNGTVSAPSVLLDGQKPRAAWIWDKGKENPQNYYLMVRKSFEIKKIPEKSYAYISAYSFADVYINGKLLDRCPMNCDPVYQVYEKYDLSGYIHDGKNTVAALVYNFGVGMHHRINARGGFFFQGVVEFNANNKLRINSDSSWKVSQAKAWDSNSSLRAIRPHLIGFVEKYDAKKMIEGWKQNNFDDSNWQKAKVIGIPPVGPWKNIVEVKRPVLFREKVYPVRTWEVKGYKIYDFGTEVSGTPELEMYSEYEGAHLELGTGERLLPDSTVLHKQRVDYTDYYTGKKGSQTWSPLTWRGFRYLSVSVNDSLTCKKVCAVNRHYNFKNEGKFECSDSLLNKIWETGVNTLKLCAQDTYVDTPWREQTQYIAGDCRYLQKYSYYSFGLSSEFLLRYDILSGSWSQRWNKDGAIRSRYPTDWLLGPGTSVYLFDYELEYVIMLGEYLRYFGKEDLMTQIYPHLLKLMPYFKTYLSEDHGLLNKVSGWVVLDHPDTYPMDQQDEITALNCLYYEALKQASYIAGEKIHDKNQAEEWSSQAEELKQNINKWLWNPEKKLFSDSYGSYKYSQQTQVYALLYGLVKDEYKGHVINKITTDGRNSEESFAYYVLYSVFDEKPEWALNYIRKYWGEQMKSPLFNGAWFESWDIGNWDGELGTTSHAWCSGPTALLSQKVLGVEPLTDGWKSFSVSPNLCDLKWAKGIVSCPFGDICVEWKIREDKTFEMTVFVPKKTTAQIALPEKYLGEIKVNGKHVDLKKIQRKRSFILSSGKYRISLYL